MKLHYELFIAILVFSFVPVLAMGYAGYILQKNFIYENSLSEISHEIKGSVEVMGKSLNDYEKDIVFLSSLSNLDNLVDSDDSESVNEAKGLLQQDFVSFLENNEEYYQLRYIDENGQEIVRVDSLSVEQEIVSEEKLQNKKDRYYFREAMALNNEGIYISPLDLNVERGEIENRGSEEDPVYVPVIRYGKKILDESGNVKGIVIANLYTNTFFNILKSYYRDEFDIETFLVNEDGYYLVHPDKNKEFGFMFGNNNTFYSDYIGVASKIMNSEKYEVFDDEVDYFMISNKIHFGEDKFFVLIGVLDKKTVFQPVELLKKRAIFLLVLFLIFLFALGFYLLFFVSRPILRLSRIANRIGKGDFDVSIKTKRKDEIGSLTRSIGEMVVSLKRYQDKFLKSERKKGLELEKEVAKKTSDLDKYISKLEKSRTAVINIMEDLRDGNLHLKDLDKAKSNFLNVVSHELKTPLTAMLAYLDILEDSKTKMDDSQVKGFNAIRRNANQLKRLINNILEISRIEAGKFELINTEIDVKEKVCKIADNLKILSENKGVKLLTKFNGPVGKIVTDEQRFEEIINNLVSNAIKFTEKGSITIESERKGNSVLFKVRDTGVGIPKDKLNELFQKFYQVDAGVSRKFEGTGLGLSITKQLIELQGGRIGVSSVEGKGTTFSFSLPIKSVVKKKN